MNGLQSTRRKIMSGNKHQVDACAILRRSGCPSSLIKAFAEGFLDVLVSYRRWPKDVIVYASCACVACAPPSVAIPDITCRLTTPS